MENKYQNGKIYKIISSQTDKIYIGSTYETLTERFSRHKNHFKGDSLPGKMSSVEMLKYDDAKIILLQNYSCDNKRELHKKENEYILLNRDICVNKKLAYHPKADIAREYYLKHRKEHNEYGRKYYILNKEKQKLQTQQRAKIDYNCVCGSVVRYTKKSDHHKTKKHLKYLEHISS